MRINKHELKLAELLTDIVGFYALLIFWFLLFSALPLFVILMAQKVQWGTKAFSFFIIATILFILILIVKWVAKTAFSRSRIGLIFIGLVLLGSATHNGFVLFDTELQILQNSSLIGNTVVQSILGFSCFTQVLLKKIQ